MKFRLKAGITQEELALRSGLSQGYINQLELGMRNYTQKSLELITVALSAPLIEFFKEGEIEQASNSAENIGIYPIVFGTKFDSVYAWEFHPNIATRMESF